MLSLFPLAIPFPLISLFRCCFSKLATHNASNGSTGAHQWSLGIGVDGEMTQRGDDAGNKIEEKVLEMAQPVFDVVAENPQKGHVASEVE